MNTTTRRSFLLSAALLSGSAVLACRSVAADLRAWPERPLLADSDAFLAAVRAGDAEAVARMLDERPELLRCGDGRGRSAYLLAHLSGHEHVARLFVERGLELDLVEAALAGDWERVEALAEAEPGSVDQSHPVGGTALYALALLGREGLWRLQDLGADPDANPPGGAGHTPSRAALECADLRRAEETAIALLGNGGDPDAPQRDRDSLLHAAVRRRSEYLVRFLIRRGAELEARDGEGRTPLELARELHAFAIADLLRGHAALPRDHTTSRFAYDASGAPFRLPDTTDLPIREQSRVTGASHKDFGTVRELVARDARLAFSISGQDELTIEACSHTGNREIVAFYLDRGLPMSLPTALSFGDLDRARALLEEDPLRVHERGPHDFALTWYPSIGGGSVEAMELLLEHGAPVDQESMETTALHWAAMRGQEDLAALLLERNARVDLVGWKFASQTGTPLQLALANGHEGVARLLRDAGAGA